MATIKTDFNTGGSAQTPSADPSKVTQAKAMRDVADDLALLKAAVQAIATKLDADAGVTDTNYAALAQVAALTAGIKTIKG